MFNLFFGLFCRWCDLNDLPDEDRIVLDLKSRGANLPNIEDRYLFAIGKHGLRVTEGGTMIEDKPVTYPGHGGVVFRILGEFKGCDVSTSFFVAKEDIYYSVISTDGEVSWQILKGSLVGIEGLEKLAAGFHVSYGKNSKDGKVREEFKYLIDSVGLECILGGLYLIKYGESAAEKSMGFEIICLHFAEAVRFNTICEWVMNALIKGQKLLLPTNIRSFVRSWQSISSVMRLAMLEPEKYTRRELIQRLNKFDVKNEEDLNKFWDHVMIIHRETEKHRKSRREKERAKHNQPPLSSTGTTIISETSHFILISIIFHLYSVQ
ncbi:hypothetical protein SOVF_099960 [Spinacia oleracea]|nr:hypothetical protein SOVF_099960 [Spinacia oleracea]